MSIRILKPLLILAAVVIHLMSYSQFYGSRQFHFFEDENEYLNMHWCEADRIVSVGAVFNNSALPGLTRIFDYNLESVDSSLIQFSAVNVNPMIPGMFYSNIDGTYDWFPFAGFHYWAQLDGNLDTITTQPTIQDPLEINEFFAFDQMLPTPWVGGYTGLGRYGPMNLGALVRFNENKEVVFTNDDIAGDWLLERMFTLSRTSDGQLLTSGIVAEYDEDYGPFYLEYDAYVGKFDWDGNLIWQHNFGHPDFFDEQGFATELPDGNVAFYYCHTDYMGSAYEYSHVGTLSRVNISSGGEILDTITYADSIPICFLHDIVQRNDRIYILGERWGWYGGFTPSFVLITDLEGNQLNYEEYFAENCNMCDNFLLDLDIAPNGDVVMGGYTDLDTLDYNSKKRSWLVKTDCMGRFSPPPLSFSASITQSGDTLLCTSSGEGVFDFSWDFGDGNSEESDTLNYVYEAAGEYTITAIGTYCTIELDTTFTVQIFDCMGNLETPGLSLNATSIQLADSTFLFSSASVNLENIFWIINGQEFLGAEVEYTFADTGVYDVEVCGWYCDSLSCETLTITVNSILTHYAHTSDLSVYPNPSSNLLHIDSNSLVTSVSIRDLAGKEVLSFSTLLNSLNIDTSLLPCGSYLLQVTFNDPRSVILPVQIMR